MSNIWAVVLAAGESSRMGKQKMLLPYKGQTIIEKVVSTALTAVKSNVVVVTGSGHESISSQIKHLPVRLTWNESYKNGMLSSVIAGINVLPKNASAFLLFLGDQPQIPVGLAQMVIDEWKKHKKGIVIPTCGGKKGHPVLIETRYCGIIRKLNHEIGLKELMIKYTDDIHLVETNIPEILRDIDTPDDYSREMNL